MSSRSGAKPAGSKRLVTYGRSSRKRPFRESLPVRAVGPNALTSPQSSSDAVASFFNRARPDEEPLASRYDVERTQGLPAQGADHGQVKKRKRTPSNATQETSVSPHQKLTVQSMRVSGVAATASHTNVSSGVRTKVQTKKSHADSSSEMRRQQQSLNTAVATREEDPEQLRDPVQKSRRRRLIDTLVAQRPKSPDSTSDSGQEGDSSSPTSNHVISNVPPSQQSTDFVKLVRPPLKMRPGALLQGNRAKRTYGESRTILTETQDRNVVKPSGIQEELDALFAAPSGLSSNDPFAMDHEEEEEEDDDVKPAIKSVHELRRAGANNRFSDEMEDILVRVGTPDQTSSVRRNALLELAQKVQHKDFIIQFRDHASRDKIAQDIGLEKDIISGFALVAILVVFFSSSRAAHLLRQLLQGGIEDLIAMLLRVSTDIDLVATKLSRSSRISLTTIRSSLIQREIWSGHSLEGLSPQLLGLQLLNMICQSADLVESCGIVQRLGSDLTAVVDQCSRTDTRDDARSALVLSILESQSSLVMDGNEQTPWLSRQSCRVAQFLQSALDKWPNGPTDILSTTLKLSINTTNAAHGAETFNNGMLLSSLSKCICTGFGLVQKAITNRRLRSETYDGLLLILGVTINILEHCPAARESVDETSRENLVLLYLENRYSTGEADSVEKSRLSVAFGYLAVLLGYLALSLPFRKSLAARSHGGGVEGLVKSIQEFIDMYRFVDSKVQELEGLVGELEQSVGQLGQR